MLGKISIDAIRSALLASLMLCGWTAQADTPITISEFDFVELDGRIGHLGLVPRSGQPLPGPGFVRAVVSGEFQNPIFKFVDELDTDLSVLGLMESQVTTGPRIFMGSVETPNEPFRLVLNAETLGGEPFQVNASRLFEPTSVLLRFEITASGGPPGARSVTATVINIGPAANFELSASDELGTTIIVTPNVFDMAQSSTADVTVDFEVPRLEEGIDDYTMTLVVMETGVEVSPRTNHSTLGVASDSSPIIHDSGFEEPIK